jgi:ribosome-binding factor A
MAEQRQEKLNREFTRVFAKYIERESNKQSLITVTRCIISPNNKMVMVYLSILPQDKSEAAIAFLNRHKHQARDYLKKNIRTRIIPFVEFMVDSGELNRQKIDRLLKDV